MGWRDVYLWLRLYLYLYGTHTHTGISNRNGCVIISTEFHATCNACTGRNIFAMLFISTPAKIMKYLNMLIKILILRYMQLNLGKTHYLLP